MIKDAVLFKVIVFSSTLEDLNLDSEVYTKYYINCGLYIAILASVAMLNLC
jgi:hypothetical protein